MTLTTSINRRKFLATSGVAIGAFLGLGISPFEFRGSYSDKDGPLALPLNHFPSLLHAFVWRNWNLVPVDRMAKTVQATISQIRKLAKEMKLPNEERVSDSQWERSYLTVVRRNWHLLPKQQLLILMDWTEQQLEFTLIEDDFFYIKLGSLKPKCDAIDYKQSMKDLDVGKLHSFNKRLNIVFPSGIPKNQEPFFQFVDDLSKTISLQEEKSVSSFSPRLAYPYFALFGDPLMSDSLHSYPDSYLDRMQQTGVDSIWMHIVLSKITPFPWDQQQSKDWENRLTNMAKLVNRANKRGIKIFLYLNEPRNQTSAFFARYPNLQGSGNSLCTSKKEVQDYLKNSIALVCERVPGLGGFFSITASENPTHCWSHYKGELCADCSQKGPAMVISDLNNLYHEAISMGLQNLKKQSMIESDRPRLIVWDWGWKDGVAEILLPRLKSDSLSFMSVSEWDLSIERGGVSSKVGEYSISSIGPGPRAIKHWSIAKQNNISCVAKIQANNSWEIGAIPYIPALYNVGRHISNLRSSGIEGLMLGWSLGGYPSPNLELVNLLGKNKSMSVEDAVLKVAVDRYGYFGGVVNQAWKLFSESFREFPYHVGVVYNAPLQAGPSNLLWAEETTYKSTMVGLPYDDLASWRSIYPEDIFIGQMEKVCTGFFDGIELLKRETKNKKITKELQQEINVAESLYLHYMSVVNQCKFIIARRELLINKADMKERLREILTLEKDVALRLAEIQSSDSRIGFEASNHYFYVPQDLYEKVLNCSELMELYSS